MSFASQSVHDRLASGDSFHFDEVTTWICANDIELAAAAYYLLQDHSDRIRPKVDWSRIYPSVLAYLIRCIRENRGSDYIHSGYEAAWELAACLKKWARRSNPDALMRMAEQELSRAFLAGDNEVKDRILNGTLEHALELPTIRPFFAHWEKNQELTDAWHWAMLWAKDHEDAGR
jgi:hypothetical protein